MMRRRIVLLLLAAFGGCAVGPDFHRPPLAPTAGYAREEVPYDREVLDAWWTLFASPQLDALVANGVAASPSLAAAKAAWVASEASIEAGRGVFFPQVDLGASALRQRASRFAVGTAGTGVAFNLLTVGVAVKYAVDVFGGNRREVEKLAADVDYQRALRDGAYLTLTGNLVNTAIANSAYVAQLHATDEVIALQRRQAALLEAQWQGGTVAFASVAAARFQLAQTEASESVLRKQLADAGNLLATLSGKTPAEWSAAPVAFEDIKVPDRLPVSLPSDLVRQRPDILAAEAGLHAASAQVGIATAALFPSVTIGADAGFDAPDARTLGKPASRTWSVGPTLDVPLFSGFSGIHARDAARAQYEQALDDYRQTVVNAFGEVGDALAAVRHDGDIEAAQRVAYDQASRQRGLAAANRAAGLSSELQEIAAGVQLEEARIGLVQARALRLQDSTALLLALGRPWSDPSAEPRP